MPAADPAGLDVLLDFIKQTRGFDFTGYKRPSIARRVEKRMAEVGVSTYAEYVEHLELNALEFAELFNTLLINVTGFFRDPQTWEHLATDVLPDMLRSRGEHAPLRVWCAGCASGEEAYTVAMVLARALGVGDFTDRVKIYATDVDEDALAQARPGAYLPRQVEDVPPEALERFFERTPQRYAFRKDLRRAIIFGRNDLIQDAPISRIDLLVCRNTLMYFTAETQSRILRRFHFALDDEGVLLLGKSEMLITHSELFAPLDLRWRVFRKVVKPAMRDRMRALATADAGDGISSDTPAGLRETAFDVSLVPQVVLDANQTLVMTNGTARRNFGLSITDIGRPIQDLELAYRPVEILSHLDAITKEPRAVDVRGVSWLKDNSERVLDVRVAPLLSDGRLMGTSITYHDVTIAHQLKVEIETAHRNLETAYGELQSTVEELETTNEELQSTNEELETTNEELQSTNEELETTNEELESTNEELGTINDELRHRSGELNDINNYLETILTAVGLAVAIVDREQHVQSWNGRSEELWGVGPDEAAGQPLFSLDTGLPVEGLRPALRAVLQDGSVREEVVAAATNRRGRPFQCRVTCLPLNGADADVSGAIVMMQPVT
jgi:two-component system CheB/CheR fusion protein